MSVEKLKQRFPRIRENEPLKNHCTFRVGGPADLFYELSNIEELPEIVQLTEESAIVWRLIGRGSNVLFTDKGFRGLIIKNISKNLIVEGNKVLVDSGALLSQIIRTSIDNHLTGLEALYGIPGTIGAAVWGNAGVPNCEISDVLTCLRVYSPGDGIHELQKDQCTFQYRSSLFQKNRDVILSVTLELSSGSVAKSKENLKKIDGIRRGKQPIGFSAGSFFKNPSRGMAAGMLIEKAGLKGMSLREAQISEKHANFFLNKGHATAADLLSLALTAKEQVKAAFGIDLEMEVKVIGDL